MPADFVPLEEVLAAHPALKALAPEELLKAVYVHDRHVLPDDIMNFLGRRADATLTVKSPEEIQAAVRVANGETTTTALGLSAQDYHFLRTKLGMRRGLEVPVDWERTIDLYDDQIIPQQGGFLLDVSAIDSIQVKPEERVVAAGVGARWKDVQQAVASLGLVLNCFPGVPMDFALGDMVGGTAPFHSTFGGLGTAVRNVRVVLPDGRMGSMGYDDVPNNGSGYNLRDLYLAAGGNFAVPHTFYLTLSNRPRAFKTLLYTFPEVATLAAAAAKLARSRLTPLRTLFYNVRGWNSSHRQEAQGPILEVSLSGLEATLPAQEKALDAMAEGRVAKTEALSILEATASEFRSATAPLRSASAIAEVLAPPESLAGVHGALADVTEGIGVFGVLSRGTAYLVPVLRRPLSRRERFDFVDKLVKGTRGKATVAGPHLVALLAKDPRQARALGMVRAMKREVDRPNTMNPGRALLLPRPG